MNQKLLGVVVAVFLLVTFGVSVSASMLQYQVGEPLENPDPGQQVYEMYCIGCHGELGDGNGTAAYALEIPPRNFVDPNVDEGKYIYGLTSAGVPTDQALHDTIAYGRANGAMPAFPLLTQTEREVVINYLKNFRADGWPEVAEGDAVVESASSEEVLAFIDEVNNLPESGQLSLNNARIQNIMDTALPTCSTCHTVDAFDYAGQTGPTLTGIASRTDYDYIIESIVNPGAVIAAECPLGPCTNAMPATYSQSLTPAEADAIARWLLSDENN